MKQEVKDKLQDDTFERECRDFACELRGGEAKEPVEQQVSSNLSVLEDVSSLIDIPIIGAMFAWLARH